jgi:hypothetical protein
VVAAADGCPDAASAVGTSPRQRPTRFSRAVDHLGVAKTETRLGAIATLEQIAVISTDDRQPVVRALTGFMRSASRFEPPSDWMEKGQLKGEKPELQAAMDALIRLNAKPVTTEPPLELTGAYLVKAQLREVNLGGAELDKAKLHGADLNRANLLGANLRGANLPAADLRGADLTDADLEEAIADERTQWPVDFDPCSAGVKMQTCP